MATGTAEHIDATTADVFIKEVWSKRAIVAREQQLVMAERVNRQFEDELAVGDTIHVPSRGHLAVVTKNTSANAATIFETITETNTDIVVQTWQYSAIALETFAKKQSNRDLLAFYAPEQGYALGLAIDDVLAGLIDDFSQVVGTLGVPNTYDEILEARQLLDDANAPADDRTWIFAPIGEANLLKMDSFIHRDYEGVHGGLGKKGLNRAYMGTILGDPVYKSTNVEGSNAAGHDNAYFHRDAIGLVVQLKATTHMQFDINYLANKVVVEQIHGSKEMRDDHGVFLRGA
jgi:hypothetical protein